MRNTLVFVAITLSLTACGNRSRGPSSVSVLSSQKIGTYFVTPWQLPALGSNVRIVGTHDSGILVEAAVSDEKELFAKAPQSFRMDEWKKEYSAYNFSSMEQKVKQLALQFPSLATLQTYGRSTQGRPEYVMVIDNPAIATPKKQVMITAATHGNETATVDVALGLMELLLKGNGVDSRITSMLSNHTVYIVPAVCVDSYVAETREADGRDPNRDYPYPEQQVRSPVTCIKQIMNFVETHQIAGTLDFHDAASMIFFPWAYTYDPIPEPDYTKLDTLTTKMAAHNGFEHGQIAETIYIAPGSSADYYYWKHHATATAIELSHNKAASGPNYNDLVDEVTDATWTFIEGVQ